jgi:hypothetical protein
MKNRFAAQLLQRLPYWLLNVSGEIVLVAMIIVGKKFHYNIWTAWCVYFLGALCLMRVWWVITRFIPNRPIRNILRLVQAALLLIPYTVTGVDIVSGLDSISWAPAIVMSAWEGMFMVGGTFGRAGTPLLMMTGMVILLYIVLELLWSLLLKPRWFNTRVRGQAATDQELQAEREELLEESRALDS